MAIVFSLSQSFYKKITWEQDLQKSSYIEMDILISNLYRIKNIKGQTI